MNKETMMQSVGVNEANLCDQAGKDVALEHTLGCSDCTSLVFPQSVVGRAFPVWLDSSKPKNTESQFGRRSPRAASRRLELGVDLSICQIGVIVWIELMRDELCGTSLSSKYWGHWGIPYLPSLLVS